MTDKTYSSARLALFLIAYYLTNAIYQGYLTLYYDKALSLNSTQIGAISAGVAIISVIAQPLWGAAGDRAHSRNSVIRMLCALSCAAILCLLFVKTFLPALLLACVFACFYTSIQPLGDSIVLENLQKGDRPFGPIRLAGGLSFAVASLIFGRVADGEGREIWSIYFVAALLTVTLVATLALPKTPGRQARGRRMSIITLLKNKELMRLMVFLTLIQITMGYFYSFFSVYFNSMPGGSKSLLGWCYFISAFAEIPYLLNSDRLFNKVGAGKLLCVAAFALAARWLIVGLSDNYVIVMLSQALHGWGFIVITVAMAKYINVTVPPELKASGQMLLAIGSFGISRVIGNLGGGVLADAIGKQQVFLICAAICFLTLAAFAPYYLRHRPLNGE